MKNRNNKKIFSAFAVLAISAATALATVPLTACNKKDGADRQPAGDVFVIDTAAYGAVPQKSGGKTYYISPEGSDNNSGESIDSPKTVNLLSTEELQTPVLQEGDTVYVLPGKYNVNTKISFRGTGAFNNYIKILNAGLFKADSGYTGDGEEVVFDFSAMRFDSANRGVQIYGDYSYWYGVDICGAGDNGMYIGGNFNTIEYCEFYNNRDTGLQLGRSSSANTTVNSWPNYNLIKNCTSHNNYDNETYGENADGFAAKLTVGYGNVFDGCIAYRNSDDGWDLYAKTDSGNIGAVIIYNCVAYENGYLEYTQRECNAKFPTFNKASSEDETNELGKNSYKTRDGDGNGFKLGGSVMEGDVVVYNSLSFENRMHGVTDNSNPGFLKITGVTSYNNSAAIDDNSESATFGKIKDIANHDTHSNIDVARQTYSYNSVNRVLSVKDSFAKSLNADNYRGAVTNSMLLGSSKTNKVDGSIDANTKKDPITGLVGKTFTSEVTALVASDVFEKLPVTKDGTDYTYNVDGARDLYDMENDTITGLNRNRAHKAFRNADGSVNMGDILAQKVGFAHELSNLDVDERIGSVLNKTAWGDYTHFYTTGDGANGEASDNARAVIERAAEALTLSVDESAVFQNFDVPTVMYGCTIEWSVAESAKDYLDFVKDENGNLASSASVSGSNYITVKVNRPLTDSELVNALKATVKSTLAEGVDPEEREFTLKIIGGTPVIGNVEIRAYDNEPMIGASTDVTSVKELAIFETEPANQKEMINTCYDIYDILADKYSIGNVIIDRFSVCKEPEFLVQNDLYDDVRYIEQCASEAEEEGKVVIDRSLVFYQTDANANPVLVPAFTPSNAGVFTIIKIFHVNGQEGERFAVYRIYVASATTTVDFMEAPTITVNRDGFVIDGVPSSATGTLYALTSPAEISGLTAADLLLKDGVQKLDFRSTTLSAQFESANNGAFYIYCALANANGQVTSKLYSSKINKIDISTKENFMKIAGGQKIGSENPSETIYLLTADLDFTGVAYTIKTGAFQGLLNGMGHTVSNITVEGSAGKVGVFYRVSGGTVENIKFKNISISAKGEQVGLVSSSTGGYFYNIAITNLTISTNSQRIGGLIGQVDPGTVLKIEQVSIINDASHSITTTSTKDTRVGGLVGFTQAGSSVVSGAIDIRIDNCYVNTVITAFNEIGGIFGTYDGGSNPNVTYHLTITSTVFAGTINIKNSSKSYTGGILGYQKGAYTNMTITDCVSVGKIYYQEKLVDVAQKNCSGILGCYNNILADGIAVDVERCVALMEEHNNAEYDVTVALGGIITSDLIKNKLDSDLWTYKYKEGSTTVLVAPYATLNFIEVQG